MEKLIIGLSGVILGSILTVLRDLLNNYRTRRKRAEYLAIRVTCSLEQFMSRCVSIVGDDGYMYGPDEQGCAQLQTSLPKIDLQSLDVDWKALPFDLMYEILNIPSAIEEANSVIVSVFEYVAGPPDYGDGIEERRFQYAKLGLMANELSTKLRLKYSMPVKNFGHWDPIGVLENYRATIEQRRKCEKELPDTNGK